MGAGPLEVECEKCGETTSRGMWKLGAAFICETPKCRNDLGEQITRKLIGQLGRQEPGAA